MKLSIKSIFTIGPLSIAALVIVVSTGLFVVGFPLFDEFELKFYDQRFRARGALVPSESVVLAVIDEVSLEEEGRWPWPRSTIARMVDKLGQDGAKVIGFDVGFLEPDENSELQLLRKLDSEVSTLGIDSEELSAFIDERMLVADNDRTLAKAFAESPAAIVLGYFYHMRESDLNFRVSQKAIDQQLERIQNSKYTFILYEEEGIPDPFLQALSPQSCIPILTEAADSQGYYSVKTDPDGAIRWMPFVIGCGDEIFPPLSLTSLWHYLDNPPMIVEVGKHGVDGIHLGDIVIPTDEQGHFLINFIGPAKTFPHYPVSDILRDRLPEGAFKDKIVLVGATALGIHDFRTTPMGPVFPGLEIHANVIDNILNQRFITKPEWSKTYDVLSIIILSLIAGFLMPRLGAVYSLMVTAGLTAAHVMVAHYVFVEHGLWLNIVYPLFALVGTSTWVTVYKYLVEQRERVKIKQTFRQYVPPLVIDEMLENPDKLTMGGTEMNLTVLFSDLEGFTTYSERYTPHEMVNILSDYYATMTELVFEYRGTLKEYVGDEMMVIYGAPIALDNHAVKACETALAMRERRIALQREWAEQGRPQLRARTGINTGNMLVGNLGSKYRFAYGVLGDQVNLGSRLEGLNKMYKTDIIIGENTASELNGEFVLRELDRVRVKGKHKPVTIFELLAHAATGLPQEQEKAYQCYADGLEAYFQQQWDEARALFTQCQAILGQEGPAKVMAERCIVYQKTPPHEEWDGVFDHLTK